jgi:hypothetical protein
MDENLAGGVANAGQVVRRGEFVLRPANRCPLSSAPLRVRGCALVVHGVLVRRSYMSPLIRRRGDLTPEAQHSKEEETDPGWAFAQLCRLGLGLVTVSHANLVGLIRIPRPSPHE